MRAKVKRLNSITLAKYVLAKIGPMSHLKLQKLVYYIDAWHLVQFDSSIIDDDFQAWIHGPVCYSIWNYFKDASVLHDNLSLHDKEKRTITNEIKKNLQIDQIELIDDVLEEYGKRSAYYLECLTHEEYPWRAARKECPIDTPSSAKISKLTMKKFYSKKYEQIT